MSKRFFAKYAPRSGPKGKKSFTHSGPTRPIYIVQVSEDNNLYYVQIGLPVTGADFLSLTLEKIG